MSIDQKAIFVLSAPRRLVVKSNSFAMYAHATRRVSKNNTMRENKMDILTFRENCDQPPLGIKTFGVNIRVSYIEVFIIIVAQHFGYTSWRNDDCKNVADWYC